MDRTIIRLRDVMKLTGLKRSSLYSAIQKADFPKQVSIGARSVGWISTEVEAWVGKRIAASRVQK
jgi:prophage regulatory protein